MEKANNQTTLKLIVSHVLPEKSRQAMLGAPTVTMERNQRQERQNAQDAEQDNSQTMPELDAIPVVTDCSRQEATGADVVQQDSKQKRTKRDASRVLPDGTRGMVSLDVSNVNQDLYQHLLALLSVQSALRASIRIWVQTKLEALFANHVKLTLMP